MKRKNHIGIGVEDVNDVIKQLENILSIRFENDDLKTVTTFGSLCDVIIDKLKLEQKKDCTNQQSFYKLRALLEKHLKIEKAAIFPNTKLNDIFEGKNKVETVRNIERDLGFELKILKFNIKVIFAVIIVMTTGLLVLFFNKGIGLFVLGISSLLSLWLLNSKREFAVNSVWEVVERMKKINYFKSRINPNTVNRDEVIKLIEAHFLNNLATKLSEINRDTIIA